MGRRTEDVMVPDTPGTQRDKGKVFHLSEMPALQAEKWGYRMFLVLTRSGREIPLNVANLGMVGVFLAGLNTFMGSEVRWTDLEPLLDELVNTCVKVVRDPKARDRTTGLPVVTPIVSDDDVEDPATYGWLRSEVLRLHTGFSPVEALLTWIAEARRVPTSETMSINPQL